MAAKKDTSAMDFILAFLRKSKKASYAEVKAAAAEKQLNIYPIMYGRAQALLGYVEMRPRGQGKAAVARAAKVAGSVSAAPAAPAAVKRGPGRPPKSAQANTGGGIDVSSLDGIISAVRNSEHAKTRYRSALEKIQSILGEAIG
jgi:hypothetical protein